MKYCINSNVIDSLEYFGKFSNSKNKFKIFWPSYQKVTEYVTKKGHAIWGENSITLLVTLKII